jgi:3-oxoacyl-[acyl-carrier-protein] synthase-1
MEARAICDALGPEQASVVSTKGYTGHMLGAAGATEAIIALQALEGWVPGSLGAAPIDPEVPLDIPLKTRECSVSHVLSNSFAFGGNNVSVLFGATS